MKHAVTASLLAISALASAASSGSRTAAAAGEQARTRAATIVAGMTLDEKIALPHGLFPPFPAEHGVEARGVDAVGGDAAMPGARGRR